ncbi:hypothetical protein [Paenibacillus sp. y28]|uniref:hypothetical protein n=1 Tax=Paenibacillus sp. y28 TaxID=3129110 RepID=UPI003018D8E9
MPPCIVYWPDQLAYRMEQMVEIAAYHGLYELHFPFAVPDIRTEYLVEHQADGTAKVRKTETAC